MKPKHSQIVAIWLFRFHGSFYTPVTHPLPLYGGICDIDCAHFIDYLKWRAIQTAIQ